MDLRTFVLVGNVSNLSDARYCAGMGVDVLGFSLDPENDESLDPETFKEIAGWLAGTKFAGEFQSCGPDAINKIAVELDLDYVVVNNDELIEHLGDTIKVILKRVINTEEDLSKLHNESTSLHPQIEHIIVESENSEMHEKLNDMLKSIGSTISILKGYDVTDSNVLDSIDQFNIHGIALSGSHEIRPGFKDYDELADILEVLEIEN